MNPDTSLLLVDQSREPYPAPCAGCGREHLRGEHVELRVPTSQGGQRIAWEGCVDCWVRMTNLDGHNGTRAETEYAVQLDHEHCTVTSQPFYRREHAEAHRDRMPRDEAGRARIVSRQVTARPWKAVAE